MALRDRMEGSHASTSGNPAGIIAAPVAEDGWPAGIDIGAEAA